MHMSNFASTLKAEIARVSRKEIRTDTQKLKKSALQYRSDIVALKRRVLALELLIKRLAKRTPSKTVVAPDQVKLPSSFSAKSFSSQRKRLGLSAAEMGTLLGVSGQSVYKWEKNLARPRASQMPAILSLRTMGKKQAAAHLSASAQVPE